MPIITLNHTTMKSIISFLMMLTITIGLSAQDNGEVKPITLPGKGNINV